MIRFIANQYAAPTKIGGEHTFPTYFLGNPVALLANNVDVLMHPGHHLLEDGPAPYGLNSDDLYSTLILVVEFNNDVLSLLLCNLSQKSIEYNPCPLWGS